MTVVRATIDIQAPIDQVFTALTDPRRAPEWNSNVIDVQKVTGYPAGVGTTWEQITMMAGKRMRLQCRIVRFEPPHVGLLQITGDQTGTVTTECAYANGRTTVTQSIDFVPPGGFLGSMAAGFIAPAVQRELERTAVRQKEMLEREFGVGRGSGTS